MKECLRTNVESSEILRFLEVSYPVHFQSFSDMPPWIEILYRTQREDGESWTRLGKGGHAEESDNTVYGYWLSGRDLDFLESAHRQVNTPGAHSTGIVEKTDNHAPVLPSNSYEILRVEVPYNEEVSADDLHAMIDDLELDSDSPEEAWMFLTGEEEEEEDTGLFQQEVVPD